MGVEFHPVSILKDLQNALRNRKKRLSTLGNAYCCPKAASLFIPLSAPATTFPRPFRVHPAWLVELPACKCS